MFGNTFAGGALVDDVARGLNFGREFKILVDSCACWDAFVENVSFDPPKDVFIGLCFQTLTFVEGDAVGKIVFIQWSV